MPRSAREKSNTGIYHVILRGINKQQIFADEEDYFKFTEIIKKYRVESDYQLYAYCLMNNHVHLLLKEGKEDLGRTFQRIGASYVHWFNLKYGRIGHLFQDRYKSEPVEDDLYFITVMRYIHQNPVKAGIVKELQEYKWSSYKEYTDKPTICETQFGLQLFADDLVVARNLMTQFHDEANNDTCMDHEQGTRINDAEAVELIKRLTSVKKVEEVKSIEKQKRDELIKELKQNKVSIRRIERLTGISFGIIRKL